MEIAIGWRNRRRLAGALALGASIVALGACGDDDATAARDGGGDGATPGVLCPVEVTYRATGSTPEVSIAGEWNDFRPAVDRLADDGTGTHRITLELAPGLYAYRFVVVGDTAEPWRLDPENPYRAYHEGVENSGLRVPDCTRPALVVTSAAGTRDGGGAGRIDATLRYDARRAGALATVTGELRSGGATRALDPSELVIAGDAITVAVRSLADGKHTVRVVATDEAGRETESVLLPVWIEPEPFRWDDALIYMIVTDRFRNGDPSNDATPTDATAGAGWHGGDLVGVQQALEEGYFESLGVNTVWLTPFNTNPNGTEGDSAGGYRVTGYHGYWPIEPLGVDPRLGGDAALRSFVEAAHARGVRVLMDLVINHVHEDHPYYSEHSTWFNTGCICGTPGCDWTERRLDCSFRSYMPDIDWESKEASEQFIADALEWLERYDLDGFRIDAVKHVVDGAVINLATRVRERFETAGTHVFLMGETAQGWDPNAGPDEGANPEQYGIISRYIAPRGAGLDGQLDFVLYFAASLHFLKDEPSRGMAHVDFWSQASMAEYPPGAIMTPYVGSHDQPRFVSLQAHPDLAWNKWADLPPQPATDEPYHRLYVALAWLFSLPGAPLLYYGDEYGEYGGADPDNRHPARFGDALSPREAALLTRVQALGQARAALPGLRSRTWRTLHVTDDVSVVARGEGDELALVAINRTSTARFVTVPVPADVAADGRTFADALAPDAPALTVTGATLNFELRPRSAKYLH